MKYSISRGLTVVCAAFAVLVGTSVCRGDSTAAGRVWFADYSVTAADESGDLGRRPFFGIQYQGSRPDTPASVIAAVAYGEGWDLRTSRYDLMFGGMFQKGLFCAGGAWHGIGFVQKDLDYHVFEHGPEALFGVGVPVAGPVSVRLAATLPLLLLSDNDGGNTLTYGYTWDIGLGARLKEWSLGVGFRSNYVADNAVTKAQQFDGPYGMAGYTW